jgi:hypothetical protein
MVSACLPVLGPASARAPLLAPPRPIDFARLVGREGWARLPEAIRRRFVQHPSAGVPLLYEGTMHAVACSWLGFLLAQFCRLIGTPVAPWPGRDVPVTIALTADAASGGIAWERLYRYRGHGPLLVRSVKQLAADGRLLECVGGGFGMRLAVFEAAGALNFRSLSYFWRGLGLTLTLPALLSPGIAHVVHQELGRGRFRFVMTIRHALFGTLFHQDGIFHAAGESP